MRSSVFSRLWASQLQAALPSHVRKSTTTISSWYSCYGLSVSLVLSLNVRPTPDSLAGPIHTSFSLSTVLNWRDAKPQFLEDLPQNIVVFPNFHETAHNLLRIPDERRCRMRTRRQTVSVMINTSTVCVCHAAGAVSWEDKNWDRRTMAGSIALGKKYNLLHYSTHCSTTDCLIQPINAWADVDH